MLYRVREFNSIYDPYFGEGKGWIFQTNKVSFMDALLYILYQKCIRLSSLSYDIVPMVGNELLEHVKL
jgi:hypothetical protein